MFIHNFLGHKSNYYNGRFKVLISSILISKFSHFIIVSCYLFHIPHEFFSPEVTGGFH